MNLFIHAAPVSLAATEAALGRLKDPPHCRHALIPELVNPRAMSFAQDESSYANLKRGVAARLHGDEERVILSCSVYNAFAPRLQADVGLPFERSDDAGVWAVLGCGTRVGVVVSYPPSYSIVEEHLTSVAAELERKVRAIPLLTENAFAFADEEPERYGAVLAEAVRAARDVDCIFLAQFSMDPFAPQAAEQTQIPVVSALEACLQRLIGPKRVPTVERNSAP
jgi:Asp/Glu/hydantoin racemase